MADDYVSCKFQEHVYLTNLPCFVWFSMVSIHLPGFLLVCVVQSTFVSQANNLLLLAKLDAIVKKSAKILKILMDNFLRMQT